MKTAYADQLVTARRIELDVEDTGVVQLNNQQGSIMRTGPTAFVATAQFKLTVLGYQAIRDHEPCRSHGKELGVFVQIDADGNVTSPLEPTAAQPDIETWLRDNFDFQFSFNGSTAGPFIYGTDQTTSTDPRRHPWVVSIDGAGIRSQIFDLDCKITPKKRLVQTATPPPVVIDQHVHYGLEIRGTKLTSADFAGKTFRVPVRAPGLDVDAELILTVSDKPQAKNHG